MPTYKKTLTNFYTIVDTQRMASYVGLDGKTVPAGPMTYFDMGYSTADLNGDGQSDLVLSLIRGAQLTNNPGFAPTFFLNDGNGGLVNVSSQVQGGVTVLKAGDSIAVGNLDADPQSEVVIVSDGLRELRTGDVVSFYDSTANGLVNLSSTLPSFSPTNNPTSGTPNDPHALIGDQALIGDLNGDGLNDVLITTASAPDNPQPAVMLINNGNDTFTVHADAGLTAFSRLHWGSGGPLDFWYNTSLIDANGDGVKDIFVGLEDNQGVRSNFIALNDGHGNFSQSNVIPLPAPLYGTNNTQTRGSAVADFNGDGRPDLVLAETQRSPFLAGRAIQLLYNTGNGFTDESARIKFVNPRPDGTQTYTNSDQITVLDFNGDGFPDIFERGSQTPSPAPGQPATINFSILLNDGKGNFQEMPRSEFSSLAYLQDPISAGVVPMPIDINKDGIIDFVVADSTDDGTKLTINFSVYEGTTAYSTGPNGINPATLGAPGFNEQYYLNTHPDVARMVAAGQVASGLAYWLQHRDVPLEQTHAPAVNITGTAGNDSIDLWGGKATGGAGNDTITALGSATTTAVYAGNRANFTLTKTSNGFTVADKTGAEGNDTLVGISRVQFADQKIALDLGGNAGKVAKLLGAVFGVSALTNKTYVGIGLSYLDGGTSYEALAQLAMNAAGATTPEKVVNLLWANVLGGTPTQAQAQHYIDALNGGMTVGQLTTLAADTSYNTTNINLVGLASTGLQYV
ncbi:MAG TPA: VCBS repeat-containing protein [Candidatus Acidoferrum sp.]|nr:VCBS repeat-containing protein [Candidatus Acidoferrum sp.]